MCCYGNKSCASALNKVSCARREVIERSTEVEKCGNPDVR